MMYIPLNAVFVALIYQDSYDTDMPFPTTMTQVFDALTRGLIRRHLVSTRQVPSEYCMPPSLQRTEDINKLPPLVAQQLLQLAKVAYESLCEKRFVFTDLGEDFEHLGIMKKTTSVNVCTGRGCSYSFHHLTLQECLSALHIAIVNPSGFKLVEWLWKENAVVTFLAGICSYNDYHSHPVYQEMVQRLAIKIDLNSQQLVHCAYECPSIMDSVKVDYSECDTVQVMPIVGFDWYATGYCISHFDERWQLDIHDYKMGMEGIDLLAMGLNKPPIGGGKVRFLLMALGSLTFSQVMTPLRNFCDLDHLNVSIYHLDRDSDDVVILQQLIAPGSGLRRLEYHTSELHTNTLVPLLQPSSLQELRLTINSHDINHELLPQVSTNLSKLTLSSRLLDPLAALIVNITSLTYLEITCPLESELPTLTSIIQSFHSLEVLQIGSIVYEDPSTNLLELIETADNIRLRKLRLHHFDYRKLPPHIHEQ